MTRRLSALAAMLLALAAPAAAQTSAPADTSSTTSATATPELPPLRRLPNQWGVRPAGRLMPLGEFPLSVSVSPDGRWGAVVHSGTGGHEVRILDLSTREEASSAPLENAWGTPAWSPDGKNLYVSRGVRGTLTRFEAGNGQLDAASTELRCRTCDEKASASTTITPRLLSAIAVTPDGRTAYATEMYSNRLLQIELPSPESIGLRDSVLDLETRVVCRFEGSRAWPHRILLHPARPVAYVALWGASAVAEVDLFSGAVERIATDLHPGEMVITKDGRRLFVACAGSNSVDEIDTKWREVTAQAETSLYPNAPPGSMPGALALSKGEVFLAAANAGNNNLALFDVRRAAMPDPLGYVPTGHYPSAVAFTPDEGLVVINARGDGTPPPPGQKGPFSRGAAQFVDKLDRPALWTYTQAVYGTSPLRGDFGPVGADNAETTNPIPRSADHDGSRILYTVYIIKGSRTYDEVLGDAAGGKGDPSLCVFGESVTPNHHALAREFVLLDNFYAEGESPATGSERSTAAWSSDFVERLWPSATLRRGASIAWPAGGLDPAGAPPGGRIWGRAWEIGIQYRSWGARVSGGGPECNGLPLDRLLEGGPLEQEHFDPCYPARDTGLSDSVRADRFLEELQRYNAESILPRLTVIHLPGDGDAQTSAGRMAEHDRALGRIVEGLSRSRFWKAMAVFIVEESAAGPDHIHPQRSVALLAGPLVKRGEVISTRYSTSSVLRTLGLIHGMPPMTQSDAAAHPLYRCFTDTPDLTPYRAR